MNEQEGMAALSLAVQSLKATTLALATAWEGVARAIENLNGRIVTIEWRLGMAEDGEEQATTEKCT